MSKLERDGNLCAGVFGLEPLEQRSLLASTPLPDISELTNPSNTVVRFETNYGDIDIELFDTAAPLTVANFLKYVRDGDYDQTIFHRLAKQGSAQPPVDPFVIQGGLARITPGNTSPTGLPFDEIPVDAPVTNEFNQSNLQRTIAMARRGGQVNSATSQFFFNMANNTFLDTVDQGFTVFARVLNDRSWDVVQDIDGLTRRDIDTSDPNDAYGEVPTSASFNRADGVQASELAVIVDAEVIKPANVAAFYSFRYYFPEGFASNGINEFIPIINANSGSVSYQVIVRSERARTQPPATPGDAADPDFFYRDKVIATDSVPGNNRRGLTVSRGPNQQFLVERNVPFAYEIWATGPISANLSHYDNGSATGESFTSVTSTTWTLTNLRKGGNNRDFVLWQNPNDEPATVTVNFFFASGQQTFTTTTEAFRRGGFNVNNFGTIPNETFALQITSTLPLVVSQTHYDITVGSEAGFSSLAIPGAGSFRGVLPLANRNSATGSAASEVVSFLNPGTTAAIVTLIFTFDDGSPDITITPAALFIQSGRRASFDLSGVVGTDGKRFTVRYSAGDKLIYAATSHTEQGDDFGVPFQYTASMRTSFAEGFMVRRRAGINLFETVSVFNPYSAFFDATPTSADLTFRFIYNDGSVVTTTRTLAGGARLDLDLHTLEVILAQSDLNKRFFGVEVVSTIPVVAHMRHTDLNSTPTQPPGGFNINGVQRTPVAFADLDGALAG